MLERIGPENTGALSSASAVIASRATEYEAALMVAHRAIAMGCGNAFISTAPGIVAARNEAVRASDGVYVVMLDTDVELTGHFSFTAGRKADAGLFVPTYATHSKDAYSRVGVRFANFANRVGWPFSIGCCMAFLRTAYDRVGGFDETWAWDDLSMGLRIRQAGFGQSFMPVTATSTRPFTHATKYLERVHCD